MFQAWKIAAAALLSLEVSAAEIKFNRDIRPLLSDRCFACHGFDPGSRKAKLRLDKPEGAFAPRNDGKEHAIVPGKPNESLVVARIFSTDPDEVMPPRESHLSLTDTEKKLIRDWIAQGAKYEPHWAFISPAAEMPTPKVKNTKWPKNEIDRFVLARLEAAKIKPSPEADRARWLRRVTLDLNGAPPTPAEVEAFLADTSANAYEAVVERLLKSPRFGERMATPWLDAARYADSYGYQSDQLSPTWPFRDWVVNAFNRNLPYDQFLTEQLAGDLLPNATRGQKLATAFNRLHRQTNEGGSVEEEWRIEYVADRVQTATSVFLGMNFECARCHDHKFDPITQRDFYSMSAFFNNIDEHGTYNDTPHVPTPSLLLPTAEQETAMRDTEKELEAKRAALREVAHNSTGETSGTNGLVAHFNFDAAETNHVANLLSTNKASLNGNSLAEGKFGKAVQFTGDDALKISGVVPSLGAADQYGALFWLRLPANATNAIIFHCTEGTDTSFYGTEFSLNDGHLRYVIKRFWPGNAIAVETTTAVSADDWAQVGFSYDGTGSAEGMRIFINGEAAKTTILKNSLTKHPGNGDASFNFGARFRSTGLKGALLDELRLFNRPLSGSDARDHFSHHDSSENRGGDQKILSARAEAQAAFKKHLDVRTPVQETSVMEELAAERETFLLDRGRYDAPKTAAAKVSRSTPAFLPEYPSDAPRNRLGLAKWLTEPNHPLTARVAVNRFWLMLFGRGLVASADNFGAQGTLPSHPELLDWLAREFINSNWDTKALLKKMVLSATYRQDSTLRRDLNEKDPENVLLARGPSHRLSAEAIRDSALAASGLLDEKRGGPPVSPYMPGDLWRESNSMSPAYKESVGGDLYRRSLYSFVKRTAPMPNMTSFDVPSREVCVVKRTATGTPQQAFVLLNDPQFVEAARVLAEKTLAHAPNDEAKQIRFVFLTLTGREPKKEESKLLAELLREQRDIFRGEPERASKLIAVGAKKANPDLNSVELAAATQLAQAIMNLDATIWKR